MRVLDRQVLGETARLFVFYALGYLALVSLAAGGRLVNGGAPLLDVLVTLPDQLAFPATLALPLALVTAIINTLGRMREDGELLALSAAGISPLRAAAAMTPLVLAVLVLVAALAHLALPSAYREWREGLSSLLRSAVATQVARGRAIVDDADRGLSVAAVSADGHQLQQVFANVVQADGSRVALFAPTARWVAGSEAGDDLSLKLEFLDARLLHHAPGPGGPAAARSTGTFPSLVVEIIEPGPDHSLKPDAQPTAGLARGIALYRRAADAVAAAGDDRQDAVIAILGLPSEPLQAEGVHSWRALVQTLGRAPLRTAVDPGLRSRLDALGGGPPDATLQADLLELCRSLPDRPGLAALALAECPPALASLALERQRLPTSTRATLDRLVLQRLLPGALREDATATLALAVARSGEPPVRVVFYHLQNSQMAWHLRWTLALSVLGYFLAACGLVLVVPARNRLASVSLGLLVVALAVLPSFSLVAGLRGSLPCNPGLVLWGPHLALALAGAGLAWWRR